MQYDYVIVGAGTAGCALASRLSEDPAVTVLLVEAGGRGGGLWETVPLGVGKILNYADRVWHDATLPAPGVFERSMDWVSGRGLGGSSAVNAMLFVRGHPAMYDRMAQAGCPGWDHASCLPAFRRLEDCRFSDSPRRGAGGPVAVSLVQPDRISDAFLDACVALGHPRVADYNDALPDGASYLQMSIGRGKRCSAARAYLDPARRRGNLTVLTGAAVSRVLFRNRAACGVACVRDGTQTTFEAKREVILTAGAVRSPAILENSGVGARALLERLGIEVVADRAEVGANLQDHLMPRLCYETTDPGTVNQMLNSRAAQVREVLDYALRRRGMFADPPLKATAYVRSDDALALPNLRLQVGLLSAAGRIPAPTAGRAGTPAERAGLDPRSSFHIGVYDIYPASRGSVHLAAAGRVDAPAVAPNYLADERDRRALVAGIRKIRALAETPPLRELVTAEIRPLRATASDEEVLAFASATGHTCWHPTGTCRMGEDAAAVVDPHCRVRGVERLRVADASVFPFITSSNTNAPVYMLAERVAEFVRRGD